MQNLSITLVQSEQYWEDKDKNLALYTKLLNEIKKTDLILLPEMFHTGFSMNAQGLAEEEHESTAIKWLVEKAKEKNAAIFTSFIAKENNSFYNRGIFVYPDNKTVFYDKRKLFTLAKEEETFTAGNKATIVSYLGWNINLQICYDLRFPEITRNTWKDNQADFDLCLFVANWPEKRNTHWKSLLVARAIENQCFVAATNRVGIDGNNLSYSGDAAVISPLGITLTPNKAFESCLIQQTISKQELDEVRTKLNFLKDS